MTNVVQAKCRFVFVRSTPEAQSFYAAPREHLPTCATSAPCRTLRARSRKAGPRFEWRSKPQVWARVIGLSGPERHSMMVVWRPLSSGRRLPFLTAYAWPPAIGCRLLLPACLGANCWPTATDRQLAACYLPLATLCCYWPPAICRILLVEVCGLRLAAVYWRLAACS